MGDLRQSLFHFRGILSQLGGPSLAQLCPYGRMSSIAMIISIWFRLVCLTVHIILTYTLIVAFVAASLFLSSRCVQGVSVRPPFVILLADQRLISTHSIKDERSSDIERVCVSRAILDGAP